MALQRKLVLLDIGKHPDRHKSEQAHQHVLGFFKVHKPGFLTDSSFMTEVMPITYFFAMTAFFTSHIGCNWELNAD